MSIVVGIDPGLDGAVAVLRSWTDLVLYRTPVLTSSGSKRNFDLPAMRELLVHAGPALAVTEHIYSMKGQSAAGALRFGQGHGMWQGLLSGLQIPYQIVTPQAWKKSILGGTAKDKRAAIEFVQHRFPEVSLLATSRSKTLHSGFADSACLAIYARMLLREK